MLVAVTFSLRPDEKEGAQQQAAPVAKAPETAEERQQRLLTSFDGALAKVSDGGDFDESGAYLDMVRWMSRTSDSYVHQRTIDETTQAAHVFDWSEALAHPALVRGEFMRVQGLISRIDTIKLMTPAGDVTDVYRCFVCETDGSEQTVVDLVRRPTPVPQIRFDVVEFDAVFFRNVSFEIARSKDQQRIEVPYLIGRTLSIHASQSGGLKLSAKTAWALLAGLVVITALVLVRSSRQKQQRRRHPAIAGKPGVSMRALFEMRMREDAARRAAAAPAPDRKPDPP